MYRAKVVGTPQAHLAGAVFDFKLPQTGIDLSFATEQLYHINGTPRRIGCRPFLLKTPSRRVMIRFLHGGFLNSKS